MIRRLGTLIGTERIPVLRSRANYIAEIKLGDRIEGIQRGRKILTDVPDLSRFARRTREVRVVFPRRVFSSSWLIIYCRVT